MLVAHVLDDIDTHTLKCDTSIYHMYLYIITIPCMRVSDVLDKPEGNCSPYTQPRGKCEARTAGQIPCPYKHHVIIKLTTQTLQNLRLAIAGRSQSCYGVKSMSPLQLRHDASEVKMEASAWAHFASVSFRKMLCTQG
jgi:hypothetical protein